MKSTKRRRKARKDLRKIMHKAVGLRRRLLFILDGMVRKGEIKTAGDIRYEMAAIADEMGKW